MDGDLDRAAVALLRKLKPEIQQESLDSEELGVREIWNGIRR
ncbi:hypothetical protein [Nonomuraea sp. NPDC049480]